MVICSLEKSFYRNKKTKQHPPLARPTTHTTSTRSTTHTILVRSTKHITLVNSNTHTKPVRIYGEPINSAVDFFEISPVINQYNPLPSFFMLGLGFMVQRVILIIVKCLSANQNQLFYIKISYMNLSPF